MEKIIEKIESYHFLNYLLPGTIFCMLLSNTWEIQMFENISIVESIILHYFIGIILSRISSTMLTPIIKKTKFITYIAYEQYIEAAKRDSKIELFQRESNQYRVYIVVFILLFFIEVVQCIRTVTFNWNLVVFAFLVILFLLSYKNQVEGIIQRVKHANNSRKENGDV